MSQGTMNKIFKTVWNGARRAYVAVSEAAGTSQGRKNCVFAVAIALTACPTLSNAGFSTGNYQNGTVPPEIEDIFQPNNEYFDLVGIDINVISNETTNHGVSLNGKVTINNGITWTFTDALLIDDRNDINDESVSTLNDELINNGTLRINANGKLFLNHHDETNYIKNYGRIEIASGAPVYIRDQLNNSGSISSYGSIVVSHSGNMTGSGSLYNYGSLNIEAGTVNQRLYGTGNVTVNGGSLTTSSLGSQTVNLQSGSINADLSASTHYTQNGGTLTTSYDSLFTSSSTNAVALSSIDLAAEVPQTPQTFTESFFNEYVPGQLRAGLANSATFNAGNVVVSSGSMTSTEASDLLNAFKETLSRVI